MEFNFTSEINDFIKILSLSAQKQNINLYFVGGIVRDNLLGLSIKDIDLIVDCDAIKFAKNLPDIIKFKSIHKDFGTVKIEYNNISIDIASTRIEHYPYSGCLPVVDSIGVDIKDDYLRRDFSINSMYAKIILENGKLKYKLIDFSDGINDIKNKTLTVLHNKSYIDDPTRILRGIDFKYRFGFDFALQDKHLIEECTKNPLNANSSIDRFNSVLRKILNKDTFKEFIKTNCYKLIKDDDLNIDFDFIDKINIEYDNDFYFYLIQNNNINKKTLNNDLELLKEFSKYSNSYLAYYFYKTKDENVIKYLQIKNIKLFSSGSDILNLGIKEGKIVGEILDNLLSEKIKSPNSFDSKEKELVWVSKKYILPQK